MLTIVDRNVEDEIISGLLLYLMAYIFITGAAGAAISIIMTENAVNDKSITPINISSENTIRLMKGITKTLFNE